MYKNFKSSKVRSKHLALCANFSADDILKHYSYCSQKTGFDTSCKLSPRETISMKCQILFSGKNMNNITNVYADELAQRAVKVSVFEHLG